MCVQCGGNMQWLREHGCPWVARTCSHAAEGVLLEVLRWAREHDCPWDSENVVQAPLAAVLWMCCIGAGARLRVG